jgi:membrane fusion protein (multidrug efflux system)
VRVYLIYCIGIVVSILFLSSCSSKRKQDAATQQKAGAQERPPARVDAFLVRPETVSESIEVPGTIVADESAEIHPEVSGRITSLNVREGVVVGKGTVLARLYDADLQAQKKKLLVQLQIAQQTESRYEKLQDIGGISKQDYDVTKLNVSNIRADLDIVNTEIQKTVIRAPFAGKLGLKEVSIGAFVTPASRIAVIQKTHALRLDFDIPEKYIPKMKPGQLVNFTVEGSSRAYAATVKATESSITQQTRSLTIRALVKGDEGGLVPGNFAKVKLAFDPDPNALLIPTQAVVPQARGKKVYLFKGGKAAFVDVTTGIRDSVMVQITSGLQKGDTVITTGLLGLKPDAKVIVRQVTNTKKS